MKIQKSFFIECDKKLFPLEVFFQEILHVPIKNGFRNYQTTCLVISSIYYSTENFYLKKVNWCMRFIFKYFEKRIIFFLELFYGVHL